MTDPTTPTSPAASPELDAEMVEKAASAIWRKVHARLNRWESNMDTMKEIYRSQATVALEAAGVKELLAVVEAARRLHYDPDHRTYFGRNKAEAVALSDALKALDAH